MSDETRDRKIIVGVDGSTVSQRALDWALGQAEATGATVTAVQAWQVPATYSTVTMVLPGSMFEKDAKAALAGTVEAAAAVHPGVEVEQFAVEGHPAKTLINWSEHADLLVVGNRGRGGFVGSLLGSVSQYCVQHASCPVVVIRGKD
jgi:nucleotide-binding universal stress UspA family protein